MSDPTPSSPETPVRCAVWGADQRPWLNDAVREGGGRVVEPAEADALVWGRTTGADALAEMISEHPHLRWVQLPWAGIEPFVDALDHDRLWTSGKGVYAEPVAEHALALALAGMRGLGAYARRTTWSEPQGVNLLGAKVTVLGAGGITRSLLRLLQPFDCQVTVVRNRPDPLDGADEVVAADEVDGALAEADLVVLALALTPETEGIMDAAALGLLPDHAWVVNVARGAHIVTDDLVAALQDGAIGGAGLDVTDPEPLPDGHPLWDLDNCIITPHTANTPEMAVPLLSARVAANVRRFGDGEPLLGQVDVELGY